MRKVLVIALCFASFGTLASMRPAFADMKLQCNWTSFNGQTTSETASCRKYGGCTTTQPVSALALKKTCFYVYVQPGAVSVTGSTNASTHYKAN
jgi:hypothetical protein